jgi:hypothetical protein
MVKNRKNKDFLTVSDVSWTNQWILSEQTRQSEQPSALTTKRGSSLEISVADPRFYPGSRIQIFSIPDPENEFFPSRILDPGSASKNLSILT